jgi:hypothetical protein
MYEIVHNNSVSSWISGIFKDRDLAICYLATIPVDLQPQLLEFPIDRYPVYLLEVDRNFTYNREADIAAFVSKLTLQDNDDWCYGNIYYVDRDWQSQRAGKDYMGMISHFHLDNEHILKICDSGTGNYF